MEESCSSNTTPTSGGTLDDPEAPAAATSRKQDNANKYFPSCSSAARLLAGARYREKNREELAIKARSVMALRRKKVQSDPEAAAKAREQAKVHEAEYRARNGKRLAFIAKLKRIDKQYKNLGGKEYSRQQAAKAEKRDYELEWEVYKASQKDEMRRKVADALWVPTGKEKPIAREDTYYGY
ncbi:hypothetical protein C8R47DRAFT_1080462 [Mycena vitilis]|nr:hypothetical protein C8R47DRAFT_1084233 [Mycena vitilis]KAJ6461946.1 hypothetical protein C8R47DRAFT_1080462 [Mycena vitilis]